MSEIKISEYFKECLDAASQHQRKADENYNACNLPTYAALEQRVRELERDWKEKCIEADTMRQHHKNAEASLREQEERDDWATEKQVWVHYYVRTGLFHAGFGDNRFEATSPTFDGAVRALRERVGPAKAGSCASAPVSPSLPTEGQG